MLSRRRAKTPSAIHPYNTPMQATSLKLTALLLLTFAGGLFAAPPVTVTVLDEKLSATSSLDNWAISSTSEGRVGIAPNPIQPQDYLMVLDDRTDNAVFSKNVAVREVMLDDFESLTLAFDFHRFNDELHGVALTTVLPESAFDGMVLRAGTRNVVIPLSQLAEGRNTLSFSTWFSKAEIASLESFTIELHQYDNFSAPNDGAGWGDFLVTGVRRLEIIPEPPYALSESQSSFIMPVVLSPPPQEDTVIYLQRVGVGIPHGSATYPAGQTVAYLTFPGFNDNKLDGAETVTLYLTDGYRSSGQFQIVVQDDELAGLALNVPQTLQEKGGNMTGTVTTTGTFTGSLRVDLTSSRPDLVTVPASVWIYPGTSTQSLISGQVNFTLTPKIDARILGDQQVTITASLGIDTISETLVILEGNSVAPLVSGPAEIIEGQQGIPLTVGINGISDTPTLVTLTSSLPEISLSQSTAIVPAGVSQIQVTMSAADDNAAESNRELTVIATVQGAGSFALQMPVIDNDLSRFSANLPTLIEKGVNLPTVLTAENRDGNRLIGFSRTADVILEDGAGLRTTLHSGLAFTNGQASVGLNFPVSNPGKYLIIRDSSGLETRIGPLLYFQRVAFAANSIIYDKTRDRILAISGGSALPGFIHSLTPVNASTGGIGTPLFLGNDPVNMDITDDGQFLYVGLRSANSVQRVALGSFTKAEEIRLSSASSTWNSYAYYPLQIMTLPGRPRDFIACQQAVTSSFSAVYPYFDGVVQTGRDSDSWSLARGATPGQFYGYNYSDTGYDFVKAAMNSTGFSTVVSKTGVLSGFSTRIAAENDIIFTNTGKVANGVTMGIIGEISFPWTNPTSNPPPVVVKTDLAKSRVFFGRGNEIAIYDSQALTLIDRVILPGVGNIKDLIRYRESGLAAITDSGQLLLINERKFVPDGDPTDLKVTITTPPGPVLLGGNLAYSYSVENTGTVTAEDVTLELKLSAGQSLQAGGSVGNPTATGGISHFIGNLAAGAKVDFVSMVRPNRLTTLIATAVTTSPTLDSNYQDNIASIVSTVGFNSTQNSVNVLELLIQDVKVNPANGSLVIAVDADAAQGVANSIVVMNPESGLIDKTIPLPGEPLQLAISGDGTVAYALGTGRNLMYRVDLANGVFSNTLSFGDISIDDFEVLSGTTNSIILGSGWNGVRIYDNGVLRPNTSGTYNGDQVELLPAPDLAFAYNTEHTGFESFKLQISPTGVSILSETSSLFTGFSNNIRSDGYYIYSPSGTVARADLMVKTGTFDLTGVFGSSSSTNPSVEPERAKRRAYFAGVKQIQSFDTDTYLKVRNVSYPTLPANFSSIERWGGDGFVAKLANQHFAIIRSDLVPDQPGALDLIVNQKNGDEFGQSQIAVTGKAFAGQGILSVTVNGSSATTVDGFSNWSVSVTLAEGPNELVIVGTPFGGSASEERRITVHYQPLIDAMARSALNVETLAPGWRGLDSDGDGHSDLAEVLFGMDPSKADQPMHMKTMGNWTGPQDLLCYRRIKAMSDSYLPATSRNLKDWDHAQPLLTYHGEPVTCEEDARYEDVFFTLDAAGEPSLFFNILIRE